MGSQSQEKETVAYDCGTWTAVGVEKNLSMNDGRQGLACIEKSRLFINRYVGVLSAIN